jgi:predicted esterase
VRVTEAAFAQLIQHCFWRSLCALTACCAIALGWPGQARAEQAEAKPWCAPELEALSPTMCVYSAENAVGKASEPRTLVIFLHSLVGVNSGWAWEQQRLMVKSAKAYGLTALIPRGRPGFGPGRDPSVLAWPTAQKLQQEYEDSVLAEWADARRELEHRTGPFARVLLFGFSNGAYYATSLALRGRLDVDGYGAFAGGTGGKYGRLLASRSKQRVPIFVGYGTKDPAHGDQVELVRMLREIGWPHRAKPERIGHTVSDAQIRAALAFLRN